MSKNKIMILSHQSQAILAAMVMDIERKLDNSRIQNPLGKVVEDSMRINRGQVEEFVNELREKILFPQAKVINNLLIYNKNAYLQNTVDTLRACDGHKATS